MNQSLLVLITILLGSEFGLKQFYESHLEISRTDSVKTYVFYRVIHITILLFIFNTLLFTSYPLWFRLFIPCISIVIGISELLIAILQKKILKKTNVRYNWLFFYHPYY